MELRASLFLFFLLMVAVLADINMQNPRGCNNRLNESRRNRRNAKRLFDSQNNNRGGHNVGTESMYYYSGSYLPIQWAHQHSCGDQNNNCEVVIQYMCGDTLRDGKTTSTIPYNQSACLNKNCNSDLRYGMHESFENYERCLSRERNMGLFTSTQRLRGISARYTRQEKKGTRYAYECPEERDYYPYWSPSPWKDIAVYTNNPDRCAYYKKESENVKGRGYCEVEGSFKGLRPNNKEACETFKPEGVSKAEWIVSKSHGIPPPVCKLSQWSRDNHQGNTIGGNFMSHDWVVPDLGKDEKCVIRIRYNISTGDYDGWDTAKINSKVNGKRLSVGYKQGLSYGLSRARGYILTNNPKVSIFPGKEFRNFRLRIAIDTGNFGRTFQDRSHVFTIKQRPANLRRKKIYNVNVRGKRGNHVQVYPSAMYDFVPSTLKISRNDYVHFQWTGSNSNPKNEFGPQGKRRTDRSNVVQIQSGELSKRRVYGEWSRNMPANLTTTSFLGLPLQERVQLAYNGIVNARFDLGPKMVRGCGTYYYMSSHNNAFSHRFQKAQIIVENCI